MAMGSLGFLAIHKGRKKFRIDTPWKWFVSQLHVLGAWSSV